MVRNVRELVLNQYLSFSTYPFQKGYSAPAPAPASAAGEALPAAVCMTEAILCGRAGGWWPAQVRAGDRAEGCDAVGARRARADRVRCAVKRSSYTPSHNAQPYSEHIKAIPHVPN